MRRHSLTRLTIFYTPNTHLTGSIPTIFNCQFISRLLTLNKPLLPGLRLKKSKKKRKKKRQRKQRTRKAQEMEKRSTSRIPTSTCATCPRVHPCSQSSHVLAQLKPLMVAPILLSCLRTPKFPTRLLPRRMLSLNLRVSFGTLSIVGRVGVAHIGSAYLR